MHDLLIEATNLLRAVRMELNEGRDISPSMRFRVEALFNQSLAANVEQRAIRDCVENLLPSNGSLDFVVEDDRVVVALQLWQQRAPVVPSAS